MLTDDLRDVLRERAADVDSDASSLLARLEAGMSRRWCLPSRSALVAAAAALAVAAGSIAVAVVGTRPDSNRVSVAGTGDVPCATPPVTPTNNVEWPCAQGPVNEYFRQVFDDPPRFAGVLFQGDLRILAFGAMPASRLGGRFVVAETWDPHTQQAQILTSFSTPARVLSESTQSSLAQRGIGPNDPVPELDGGGRVTSPVGALILVSTPHPSAHFVSNCQAQLARIPRPRHGYLAACSDIVVTRSDVTTIQLLHNGHATGEAIPVTDRAAGLPSPRMNRPGWTIQALDGTGHVVGSTPWRTTF